jgi:hypothetical protein
MVGIVGERGRAKQQKDQDNPHRPPFLSKATLLRGRGTIFRTMFTELGRRPEPVPSLSAAYPQRTHRGRFSGCASVRMGFAAQPFTDAKNPPEWKGGCARICCLRLTADLNSSYSPTVVRLDAMRNQATIASPFRVAAKAGGGVGAPAAETAHAFCG